MSFQKAGEIFPRRALGIVGELFDNAPWAANSRVIQHDEDENNNIIGRMFTVSGDGQTVQPGGAGTPFGILGSPKTYPNYTNFLDSEASLMVPNGLIGEFFYMGNIILRCTTVANVGDALYFSQATGEIAAYAPGTEAPEDFTLLVGARVMFFQQTAENGLIVARLLN